MAARWSIDDERAGRVSLLPSGHQSSRASIPRSRISGAPCDHPHRRPQRRRARRGRPRHDRLALEASRLHLPVVRDLRRHQRRLGLRAARRRAQEQRQARLVARDGPGSRRHRRPRRRDPDAPPGVGHARPRRLVQRPAGRVRELPPPLPARRAARRRGPERHRAPGPGHRHSASAWSVRTTAARCRHPASST